MSLLAAMVCFSAVQFAPQNSSTIIWALDPLEKCKLAATDYKLMLNTKDGAPVSQLGERYYFQRKGQFFYVISRECPELAVMQAKFQFVKEVISQKEPEFIPLSSLSKKALLGLQVLVSDQLRVPPDAVVLDSSKSLQFAVNRFVSFSAGEFGEYKVIAQPLLEDMTEKEREEFIGRSQSRFRAKLEAKVNQEQEKDSEKKTETQTKSSSASLQVIDDFVILNSPSHLLGYRIAVSNPTQYFLLNKEISDNLTMSYSESKNLLVNALRVESNGLYNSFRGKDKFNFPNSPTATPSDQELQRYRKSLKFNLEQNGIKNNVIDSIVARATFQSRTNGLIIFVNVRMADGTVIQVTPSLDF
jgi:hypothetical protein